MTPLWLFVAIVAVLLSGFATSRPTCPAHDYSEMLRKGMLMGTSDPASAAACWAAAVALQPKEYDPWEGLYKVALSGNAAAARVAEDATQLYQGLGMSHMAKGRVLASMGRTMEAVEAFRRTVQIQPDTGSTYNNLALLLKRAVKVGKSNADEVIRMYQTAQALLPSNPHPASNLGIFLAGEGRFDDAIKAKMCPACSVDDLTPGMPLRRYWRQFSASSL